MKYKIYVINLDQRPDKYESAISQIQEHGLTCQRVSAINGATIDPPTLKKYYNTKKNAQSYIKDLSLGEIGCYLSHIKVWKEIVEADLDYAVVLEDDCKLESSFSSFPQIIEKLKNWDYIKIAGTRGRKKIKKTLSITNEISIAYYNKVPTSTVAQIISKQGAIKLLKHSTNIYRPVDIDLKHYWEKDINIIGIEPKLADNIGFDSDIESLDTKGMRRSKTNRFRKFKYTIHFNILNFTHNIRKLPLTHFKK